MGSIKEILKKINLLVQENFASEKKEENFINAKDKDGVIYSIMGDVVEVGAEVMIVSEDGTSAPATDGEIVLDDGSKLTVKDGKIESITPAEEEKMEENTETDAVVTEEKVEEIVEDKIDEKIEDLITKKIDEKIAEVMKANKNLMETVKQMSSVFSILEAENEALKTRLTAVEKIPATGSIQDKNKTNPKVSTNKWMQKIQ